MATRAQLEQYAKNPNVRKFLDLISYTEGTQGNGYRTAFGGGRLNSLNDHPRYSKSFKQLNGKTNTTSAAGRYQFLRGTWDNVARQYGLRDFSPHSQDLGAIALLIGRNALAPLLKGDWQTAVRKAGPEWASLPTAPASYSQPTKSWAKVNKFWTGKASPAPSGYAESSAFERPPLINMSGFNAVQFERPPLIDMSGFNAESRAFERPALINMADIQTSDNDSDINPSAFERPKLLDMADLQANDIDINPSDFERPPLISMAGAQDDLVEPDINPTAFERPPLVNMSDLSGYDQQDNPLQEFEPQG